MKNSLIIMLVAAAALTGCSSAFKAAQTPDDVYYSYGATPAAEEKYTTEAVPNTNNGYKSYWQSADDRYLQMKVQDRTKWSTIDDANYWYGYNNPGSMWNSNWYSYNMWSNPYMYNSMSFSMYSNPFMFSSYYNSWSNPYCWNRPVVVVNKYPTSSSNYIPRPSLNYAGFNNSLFNRSNINTSTGKPGTYSNQNSGLFRTIFGTPSGSSGNSGDSYTRPMRLFDGSGSSGSGSSGGSSRSSGSSSSGSSGSGSSSRGGRGG